MHKLSVKNTSKEKPVTNLALYLGEGGFSFTNSEFLMRLKYLRREGVYLLEAEGRLDLAAYRIYGSTRYWWVVAYYNGITDPFTVPLNRPLNYPAQRDLESLYFDLRSKARMLERKGSQHGRN